MSYKTELQSNNTDIQTIEKYIDEFGSLIAGQDNLIAQIQTALEGKAIIDSGSEASVNDIGVFTMPICGNVNFLFIKGMTFGEFCASKMNKPVYITNESNMFQFSDWGDTILLEEISEGSTSFAFGLINCTTDTIIEETAYWVE